MKRSLCVVVIQLNARAKLRLGTLEVVAVHEVIDQVALVYSGIVGSDFLGRFDRLARAIEQGVVRPVDERALGAVDGQSMKVRHDAAVIGADLSDQATFK